MDPSHTDSRPRIRWWLTLLDLLGVGLSILTGIVFVTGGYRFKSDSLLLSVTSWQRLVFWSAAVITLRHLLVLRPSLLHRLASLRHEMRRRGAVLDVLAIGAGTRLAVLLLGYLAIVFLGTASPASPFTAALADWTVPPDSEAWRHVRVAQEGYTPGSGVAWLPVFPALALLMRLAGLFSLPPLAAGTAISLVAFVGAVAYVNRLAREHLGRRAALVSMTLLAAYPWAFTHSLVGVEALFLLAAAGAFYHLKRGQQVRAAAWGALLGLTRPAGILMVLPLAAAAWTAFPALAAGPESTGYLRSVRGRARLKAMLPAAVPVAGLAIALAYAGGWTRIFGTTPSTTVFGAGGLLSTTGAVALLAGSGLLPTISAMPFSVLDAFAAFFALALLRPVARRFGLAYGLFIGVALLSSVLFDGESSMGQQTAVLFPLFLWMGATLPRFHHFAWVSLFAMFQALATVLFFTRRVPW